MEKRTYIFLIIILLILISFQYDNTMVREISKLRNNFLDSFFAGLTFISSEIIIFFFLTSLFLWSEKKREWILPLWFTLFVSAVISFILKYLIQRPRPFQIGLISIMKVLEKANFSTWNFSFPSFQTMFVFSAIPILSKEFPRLKKFWIILSVLVGFSRVYFGLHFLSDVIVGGVIGYFIGVWVIDLEKENRFGRYWWKKVFGKKEKI